ncbi:MAG: capsular biosynthesis protein CpsI, partial [Nitrospina sp.]|nr:capsular biosynthesis protein CpsI [Nitrospina sp.]
IEKNIGIKAKLNMMPMQNGDVKKSHAEINDLNQDFDYAPQWNIQRGVKNFVDWYLEYYKIDRPTS